METHFRLFFVGLIFIDILLFTCISTVIKEEEIKKILTVILRFVFSVEIKQKYRLTTVERSTLFRYTVWKLRYFVTFLFQQVSKTDSNETWLNCAFPCYDVVCILSTRIVVYIMYFQNKGLNLHHIHIHSHTSNRKSSLLTIFLLRVYLSSSHL